MHQLLTRNRRTLACLLGLTGCVHDGARPPEQLATASSWATAKNGFVFTSYYFTAAQANDPRLEANRLQSMGTVKSCDGGTAIVRREIRWFPATPISGQRCAAIVYTVKCNGRTDLAHDDLAEARSEAMFGELDAPLENACGEKDRARVPLHDANIDIYREHQALLVDDQPCDLATPTLDGTIRLTDATRIASTIRFDRALAARYPDWSSDYYLPSVVKQAFRRGLYRAGKLPNIFPPDGIVSDRLDNIRITLSIGLNHNGRPHCVQLTARQGGHVWRRTIDRAAPTGPGQLFFSSSGAKGGRPTPLDDADSLAVALCVALGLPPVAPDGTLIPS
ncbi:MAG: hypothetical protein ABIS51_11365 [Sphingomonas sp.]